MTLTSPRPVTHTHKVATSLHTSRRSAGQPLRSSCSSSSEWLRSTAPLRNTCASRRSWAATRSTPLAAARAGLLVGVGPPGCTGSSPPPPPPEPEPAPPRHSHGVRVRVRVCVCARQRLARATRRAAPRRGSVRPRWRPHIAHCTRVVERVSEGVTRPSAPLHPATHSARAAAPPRARHSSDSTRMSEGVRE